MSKTKTREQQRRRAAFVAEFAWKTLDSPCASCGQSRSTPGCCRNPFTGAAAHTYSDGKPYTSQK